MKNLENYGVSSIDTKEMSYVNGGMIDPTLGLKLAGIWLYVMKTELDDFMAGYNSSRNS